MRIWLLLLALTTIVHADRQLKLVNAIWRHGDRSPTVTFPNDQVHVADWNEGGGGRGQLSTTGMKQHVDLGNLLRNRYIVTQQFLSQQYNSAEIYVRSTDVNRTIISAISNMIGMYSQTDNGNRAGIDYPNALDGWPGAYVPIPIHTVDDPTDYVGNPDARCERQDQLWELVKQSDDYIAYENFPRVQQVIEIARNGSGMTNLNLDNMDYIVDTIFIEELKYGADQIRTWYPWYTDIREFFEMISNDLDDFADGDGMTNPVVQGVDTSTEIKKLRGGALIRSVNDHLHMKINAIQGRSHSAFYINLKYYVISAHDTTVAAYLSVLGAKDSVISPKGFPQYSACVLTELFYDDTTNTSSVRLLYRASDADGLDFTVITKYVTGCPQDDDYCDLAIFDAIAKKYDPGDNAQLCSTPPQTTTTATTQKAAGTTSTAPADRGSSSSSTTSSNGGGGDSSSSTTSTTAAPTTSSATSVFGSFLLGLATVLLAQSQ